MQTLKLFVLGYAQKNYMFDYSYTHSTYYDAVTMTYSHGTGVVLNG